MSVVVYYNEYTFHPGKKHCSKYFSNVCQNTTVCKNTTHFLNIVNTTVFPWGPIPRKHVWECPHRVPGKGGKEAPEEEKEETRPEQPSECTRATSRRSESSIICYSDG